MKPKYHNENCSPAQLLTEIVVERFAKKKGKKLPPKFWTNLEWKQQYRQQIVAANALLKLYSLEAILNALNGKCDWCYSLRTNQLKNEIAKEQATLDNRKTQLEQQMSKAEEVKVEDTTKAKPRPVFKKGNKFNVD